MEILGAPSTKRYSIKCWNKARTMQREKVHYQRYAHHLKGWKYSVHCNTWTKMRYLSASHNWGRNATQCSVSAYFDKTLDTLEYFKVQPSLLFKRCTNMHLNNLRYDLMHFDNNRYKAVCTSDQMYPWTYEENSRTHVREQTTLLHFIPLILLWPLLFLLNVKL